jgi:outer membrane protein TolC
MVIALCAGAFAAEDLTFPEAVRLALENGAQARIVSATGEAARAEARSSAAYAGNPEVSVERKPGETTLLLAVPIDPTAPSRAGAARREAEAADVREKAGRAAVASAAGAAYLDALRARDLADVAGDALGLADRLRATGEARFSAGEIGGAEHALLLADAAGALDRALSLRRDADAADRRLGVLVGAPDARTPTAWPALGVPEIDASRIPSVLAADLDARAALARVTAARLATLPTLAVSGGWVAEGDTGPVYGATLTLPLFSPGVARAAEARATRDRQQATAELATLDAGVALADARDELDIAERVAKAWDIPDLGTALDAAARRYAAGESSVTVFVAERNLALEALQHAIDARWRLQRARLALWELAGEPPAEMAP